MLYITNKFNIGQKVIYQDIVCCIHMIHVSKTSYSYSLMTKDERIIATSVPEGALKEFREPILTDKEKEYLGHVIKPFRDKIKSIIKMTDENELKEFISITLFDLETFSLPYFTAYTMYNGMKIYVPYTLKDLDL